jgi:hypothetical protein
MNLRRSNQIKELKTSQVRYRYRICDFHLSSNVPFLLPQVAVQEPKTPDIEFTLKSSYVRMEETFPNRIHLGHIKNGAGHPSINVYKINQGFLLDCNNGYKEAEFVVASDGTWIDCYPQVETSQEDIETWLFGLVLSFLLQGRGIFSLHASSVVCHGRAIGFLGNNGYGKSTLAFFFLEQGHSLVTDDVLPIVEKKSGFFTLPVCPAMNLLPKTVTQIIRKPNINLFEEEAKLGKRRYSIETLDYGFSQSEIPLGGLYFLNRLSREEIDTVRITPVPQAKALLELLGHTRANSMIELPNQKNLLETYANLASRVPVQRLEYPQGLEFLPEVYEAVLKDIFR